jgi:SAM-dependent methyltransferase
MIPCFLRWYDGLHPSGSGFAQLVTSEVAVKFTAPQGAGQFRARRLPFAPPSQVLGYSRHAAKVRIPMPGDRARARELAEQYIKRGDPAGWFEQLYKEGEAGKSVVPWADRRGNPHLLEFWRAHPQRTEGKTALVVGCGLGDDAGQLAEWGYRTTAFDISETAIRQANNRFLKSGVEFRAVNLFEPPPEWKWNFDFVFEANTIQALPGSVRSQAIQNIAAFVRPRGKLLVIARGREPHEPEGQLPWPLLRSELNEFLRSGLTEESFVEFFDSEEPPSRRYRALYVRPE